MYTENEKIIPVNLEDEMRDSYLRYAMSVIVSRALPDVRDGLKPSQRRILVAMHDLNLSPGRGYRKCAKIAGDTSGNYHPHGEAVVYPTLVRMAQDFNLRYPLVDGQGNFGSVDGDPPAAMRYTEARMASPVMEMLGDLEKNTVDFVPNYDETREEPTVLPAKFPNLLCNGSSGIAVGMATQIPPHNLSEVADGVVALVENPNTSIRELSRIIKGPDFPTGAAICGREGIRKAYETGRGLLTVRAKASIERQKNKETIVITEIPYQVNKTTLIESIAALVQGKRIEGISDLRDESDRDGMRVVVELKRDQNPDVVLNQLYKHTQMQTTFGVIMLALVENQPRVLNLKQMLSLYIDHRREIITRHTRFELEKAEARAHILEGLKIALDNLDRVIKLIRSSATADEAKKGLIKKFGLSPRQAQAILEMQLQRLTGLEREKIEAEYLDLIKKIGIYKSILASGKKVLGIIKDEITEVKKKFGDERRTEILARAEDIEIEDLIAVEDVIITISHTGYIKRLPVGTYRKQARGGKGVSGAGIKEEDFIEQLFIASTHDYILFFTDKGRVYWLKVHEIPQAGRLSRGKAVVNLLMLKPGEKISGFVPVKEFEEGKFLVMATRHGRIKKTKLIAYSHPRRDGIAAISLGKGDELIDCKLTDGERQILLATKKGKAIRFEESQARAMGRTAAGVRGIRLDPKDEVVAMEVADPEATLLTVSENGFGKRTKLARYRITRRGGKGVANIKATKRNGLVVGAKTVGDEDDLMMITSGGMVIRYSVRDVRPTGRATQGVKLINLKAKDNLVSLARVAAKE